MRKQYDEQLEVLHSEMINMGALCEEAISTAILALSKEDDSLLERVFETDGEIDQKESEIENLCLKLLLQQQPVASDLRAISSALKMISDMERIGDQASDIAEISKYIIGHRDVGLDNITTMAVEAVKMVTNSVKSYVEKDLELARQVVQYDDVVDDWFIKMKVSLIDLIQKDDAHCEYYVDLLMIAKYLERIGDHATNIAEWVEFCITGVHVSHE